MAVLFRIHLLVTAAYLLPASAMARDAADAAAKWGMIGTWAPDCTSGPSRSNVYLIYQRRSGGRLVHKRDFGDARDENDITETTLLPDGKLELVFDLKSLSPPQKRRAVFEKVSDDVYRAFENQVVGTSDFSVKDGKLHSTGAPMRVANRCR